MSINGGIPPAPQALVILVKLFILLAYLTLTCQGLYPPAAHHGLTCSAAIFKVPQSNHRFQVFIKGARHGREHP
jgi:hypothetical protein